MGFAHDGDNPEKRWDALWGELSDRYNEIPHVDPDVGFGVHTWAESEKHYLVGLAVRESGVIPAGMAAYSFDAHAYAVFTHNGRSSGLTQTLTWIFQEWLPGSGYERDGEFYFEYYDDRFQPDSRDSVVFVWVPVREKKEISESVSMS